LEVAMSQRSDGERPAMDDLSALMDGELVASEVARACSTWRDSGEARASWHAYHLIGDVLRSDDLAADPGHDAEFLAAFRQRLAQEPVILAPAAVASVGVTATKKRHLTWAAPAAVAAGFMAVAGVLVVTQMSGAPSGEQLEAAAAPRLVGGAGVVRVSEGPASASAGESSVVVLDGQLIRDARLDEYLAAHKKFGGSSVLGGPSGFMHKAAVTSSGR